MRPTIDADIARAAKLGKFAEGTRGGRLDSEPRAHYTPMKTTHADNRHSAISSAPLLIAAVTLVLAISLRAAVAQEFDELSEEPALPQLTYLGEAGATYQGEADIDGGGRLQVGRFDIGAASRTDFLEKFRWSNTFSFAANEYDFDGGGFSTGTPWETILQMRLGTKLRYGLNEQWGIFGGGVFIFSPETEADWGQSFTGGGMVGADYRPSKNFFVSLGVAVISQIENDPRVTPIVGLNWLPYEQWTVRVGAVPASGGAAATAEVAYRIVRPVELGLGAVYNQRRFRLDGSGVARDGVGEDTSLPVRVRVGWNINQNISLQFLGGVALGGQLELDNSNGNRLRRQDYDPAPYLGVHLLGGF